MTRLWRDGVPLSLLMQDGQPARFQWQGELHRVQRITNHWRVDSGWWRFHIWRDYFKLVTRSEVVVVVYHDLSTERWFLLRVYD